MEWVCSVLILVITVTQCHPGWNSTLREHPSPSLGQLWHLLDPLLREKTCSPRKHSQQLGLLTLPRHCSLPVQLLVLAEVFLCFFLSVRVPSARCHVTKKQKQTRDWFFHLISECLKKHWQCKEREECEYLCVCAWQLKPLHPELLVDEVCVCSRY